MSEKELVSFQIGQSKPRVDDVLVASLDGDFGGLIKNATYQFLMYFLGFVSVPADSFRDHRAVRTLPTSPGALCHVPKPQAGNNKGVEEPVC